MASIWCLGIFLLGFGIFSLFNRDMAWELNAWSLRSKGMVAERSDEWETWNIIGATFMIFVGAGILFFGLANSFKSANKALADKESLEVSRAINVKMQTIVPTMEAYVDSNGDGPHFMSPAQAETIGLDREQVIYGQCQDTAFDLQKTFYVLVFNWDENGADYSNHRSYFACSGYIVNRDDIIANNVGERRTWVQVETLYEPFAVGATLSPIIASLEEKATGRGPFDLTDEEAEQVNLRFDQVAYGRCGRDDATFYILVSDWQDTGKNYVYYGDNEGGCYLGRTYGRAYVGWIETLTTNDTIAKQVELDQDQWERNIQREATGTASAPLTATANAENP